MKTKKVIAFTGSHGVGKTAAADLVFADYQRGHPGKSVRLLCDLGADCRFPISTETTAEAQMWLFTNHIQKELEALGLFDVLIIDRTVVDIIAYTYAAGFQGLALAMLGLAELHVSIYNAILFKQIQDNPFCFQGGIRDTEHGAFRMDVERTLKDMYAKLIEDGFIAGKIYYV